VVKTVVAKETVVFTITPIMVAKVLEAVGIMEFLFLFYINYDLLNVSLMDSPAMSNTMFFFLLRIFSVIIIQNLKSHLRC
jgi:hypothetical protein